MQVFGNNSVVSGVVFGNNSVVSGVVFGNNSAVLSVICGNYSMPPPLDGFTTILDTPRLMVLEDNRDNNNNRKNGRNIGCHEVTYNTDNRDYLFYYGCPRCLCCRLKQYEAHGKY